MDSVTTIGFVKGLRVFYSENFCTNLLRKNFLLGGTISPEKNIEMTGDLEAVKLEVI